MKKVKAKNPLIRRIPRELAGDWKKYFIVSVFLILTIGFVSGMYVANGSMEISAAESRKEYKLESGHFILKHEADGEFIQAVRTGEKADILSYYTDKAKRELDKRFEEEFPAEFKTEFDSQFSLEFEKAFAEQLRQKLKDGGLDSDTAEKMLPAALIQAKEAGDYNNAYDKAYSEAYDKAYIEAYNKAYDEAWSEISKELDGKIADANEKYELDSAGFKAVQTDIYKNFFMDASEDKDNDGTAEGTVRVYAENDDINMGCLMEGRFPQSFDEIAIDRMHADNAGIKVGETITVGGQKFKVVGLISYVNYYTLHEKSTDLIFDAIKFDVAMVTDDGFERLSGDLKYCYAWKYIDEPKDEQEEKSFSDSFMKALLTHTVTADNEIADYIPAFVNPAINFATDDMGRDKVMGGTLLDILTLIIAFIFAITISNTVARESCVIGTLRASGYSRGELILHYLSMPVIVTVISAVVGNILGYTLFKNVVVSMYYNSYSLPAYKTIWSSEAFIKTTLIPTLIMLAVNLTVIAKMMGHTPLQFLRCDLKKTGHKRALRLPKLSFMNRFRLRIVLQNAPNYAILFIGILFIATMLAMAVGMPDTLEFYKTNAENMMFAKYQYILSSCEDETGQPVITKNTEAEPFATSSLMKKGGAIDEEISVLGIENGSRYVDVSGLNGLGEWDIYISEPFAMKYKLSLGDSFVLDERFEKKSYRFNVAGIYEKCQSLAVFMPIDNFRRAFGLADGEYSGYLCDTEITDIADENIAAVITKRDITKMCDQLDHSMGSYMKYFQVLCIFLSAALIYLLTKLIIEKNENAISMVKILGYESHEIAGLYLVSTTVAVIMADILSTFLGSALMDGIWQNMMAGFSGWFAFKIAPAGYIKIFGFILIGYLIVAVLDFLRIKRIPMDTALKNIE